MTLYDEKPNYSEIPNTELVKSTNAYIEYFSEGPKNSMFTAGADTYDPVDRLAFFHSITKAEEHQTVRTRQTIETMEDASLNNLQDTVNPLSPNTSLSWANKINRSLANSGYSLQAQAAIIRLFVDENDLYMDATITGPVGMVRVRDGSAKIFLDAKSLNEETQTYNRFLGRTEDISNENAITAEKTKLAPDETLIFLTATDTKIFQHFCESTNNNIFQIVGTNYPDEIGDFLDHKNYANNMAENIMERLVSKKSGEQTEVQKIVRFLKAIKSLPGTKYSPKIIEDTQVMLIRPRKQES
jgi:hypothetical protein